LRLGDALTRPELAGLIEDYLIYRCLGVSDPQGRPLSPTALDETVLARLLLDESRRLAPAALSDLLGSQHQYTAGDRVVLTWDSALVVEPAAKDRDIEILLELANAQLLELRLFDERLDGELSRLHQRIAAARGRPLQTALRGYRPLLSELHTVVADTTELLERIENALKITDDIYLARVYRLALACFRGQIWEASVARKLATLRGSYDMLNGEAQTARAEWLEFAVLLLIALEIVLGLARR
jgi:hypothetical protein